MIALAEDEKALVHKLISGDELAFKKLYDSYKNKLYTFCLKLTKSEELAEEIVQDVFLKIWLQREKINPDLTFGAFLYKITKNASLNFIKKASVDMALKHRFLSEVEKMHNDTENALNLSECEHYLNKAIEKLPPQQQLVFKMSRMDGMTHSEIASELNLSKGTVKNYMMIAIANVKKYLLIHTDQVLTILFAFFTSSF